MVIGETITLTDTKGVLSNYDVTDVKGATITKSGNTLYSVTISTKEPEKYECQDCGREIDEWEYNHFGGVCEDCYFTEEEEEEDDWDDDDEIESSRQIKSGTYKKVHDEFGLVDKYIGEHFDITLERGSLASNRVSGYTVRNKNGDAMDLSFMTLAEAKDFVQYLENKGITSSRRPIKSSNNGLFNQIKDYLEGETAGKGIIRSIGNNLYFRSLIITVYKDGYIMRDDTHDKYFEGDTFEEFKDDYWKWVNPF